MILGKPALQWSFLNDGSAETLPNEESQNLKLRNNLAEMQTSMEESVNSPDALHHYESRFDEYTEVLLEDNLDSTL